VNTVFQQSAALLGAKLAREVAECVRAGLAPLFQPGPLVSGAVSIAFMRAETRTDWQQCYVQANSRGIIFEIPEALVTQFPRDPGFMEEVFRAFVYLFLGFEPEGVTGRFFSRAQDGVAQVNADLLRYAVSPPPQPKEVTMWWLGKDGLKSYDGNEIVPTEVQQQLAEQAAQTIEAVRRQDALAKLGLRATPEPSDGKVVNARDLEGIFAFPNADWRRYSDTYRNTYLRGINASVPWDGGEAARPAVVYGDEVAEAAPEPAVETSPWASGNRRIDI
jgi:hypothetical protein